MEENNYLKVLKYLSQFQGDGKMYEIESLLGENIGLKAYLIILGHLVTEGLIEKSGGHKSRSWTFIGGDGHTEKFGGNKYYPLKARITLKGLNHLKSLEMQNTTVINSTNAFVNNNSPNSTFNVNFGENSEAYREISEQIRIIRETIENDKTITAEFKEAAIESFSLVLDEIDKEGKVQPQTRTKVLDWGSKISSIGSFTINLIRLIGNVA